MTHLCEQNDQAVTTCPPQERFAWLIEHVKAWREVVPGIRGGGAIELFFYPWHPGHEVVAELTLRKRGNPYVMSRMFKLVTRKGEIELRHKAYRVTLPENDQAAIFAAIDDVVKQFWDLSTDERERWDASQREKTMPPANVAA